VNVAAISVALGLDRDRGERDPLLHQCRPQLADLGVGGLGRRTGHRDRTVRSRHLEERLDAVAPQCRRVAGQRDAKRLEGGVCLVVHLVQQRQQHRVFGPEIEVEGGAGDARALCQIVHGEVGQRALFQQPLGGGQDRLLAVVTRVMRRTAATGGMRVPGVHRGVGHGTYLMGTSIYAGEIVDENQR
jgi:hypothetical protein